MHRDVDVDVTGKVRQGRPSFRCQGEHGGGGKASRGLVGGDSGMARASALLAVISDRVQGCGRSSLASCRAGATLPLRVNARRATELETPRQR